MFFGFGPVHTHSVAVCMLHEKLTNIFSFKFHTLITFSHVTLQFNVMVNVIFSSPATVAAIIAYLLDCTHLYWEVSVRKDSGWHWWEKFKSYRYDVRSEEFYCLPYGLSRYFPSL
jgi:solute carrier family 23 (nucleobase transporter), member 1